MKDLPSPSLPERIDALVDGTLDESAQVALLTEIENEAPEAWRSLALAYVEADILESTFQEEVKDSAKEISPAQKSSGTARIVTFAAAASLLIGLIVGTNFVRIESSPSLAESNPAMPMPADAGARTNDGAPPRFHTIESLDIALRNQGLEPRISTAVYQTELPDGRRLYLPMQTLSLSR